MELSWFLLMSRNQHYFAAVGVSQNGAESLAANRRYHGPGYESNKPQNHNQLKLFQHEHLTKSQ